MGTKRSGGICATRHLANRGARISLCLSNPEKLVGVPRFQYKFFKNTPGKEIPLKELSNEKFDLISDAVIGYSLKGVPTGAALELIRWANQAKTPILSLDVPPGVDSTTGETSGDFIRADWTMTLALPKTGIRKEHQGELYLADIGIPKRAYDKIGIMYTAPFGKIFCIRVREQR